MEPCVIEILGDDDDDEKKVSVKFGNKTQNGPDENLVRKQAVKLPAMNVPNSIQQDIIEIFDDDDYSEIWNKQQRAKRRGPPNKSAKIKIPAKQPRKDHKHLLIDLTEDGHAIQKPAPVIPVLEDTLALAISTPWSCGRCTYKNSPNAILCIMCFTHQG
jgi:hypothetical protein